MLLTTAPEEEPPFPVPIYSAAQRIHFSVEFALQVARIQSSDVSRAEGNPALFGREAEAEAALLGALHPLRGSLPSPGDLLFSHTLSAFIRALLCVAPCPSG